MRLKSALSTSKRRLEPREPIASTTFYESFLEAIDALSNGATIHEVAAELTTKVCRAARSLHRRPTIFPLSSYKVSVTFSREYVGSPGRLV